jgi:hypothetical protein
MALLRRALSASWIAALAVVPLACHELYDGEIGVFRCEQGGAYGPPACPVGMTCLNGVCGNVGAPLGQGCVADADCRAGSFCLDPATMGVSGAPRCSRLCCASNECDEAGGGQVCWAPPNATGAVCWGAADVGRAPPGEGRQGASCMDGSTCRSGVCEGGRCADMCCSDSYCAADHVCRIKTSSLSERSVFGCGEEAGAKPTGVCNTDDDCVTGICADAGEGVSLCATPCCSSRDCTDVLVGGVQRKLACVPVEGFGALRACSQLLAMGAEAVLGAACQDGGDCRSGLCIESEAGRICSDTCCEDASCGDSAAYACQPAQDGDTWALRCVPR